MQQTQEEDDVSSPEQSPEPQTQRRRTQGNNDDEDGAFANDNGATQNGSAVELAKKLVRLALACEYGRRPIRRQDINEKVLGSSSGRTKLFNAVFQQAQHELEYVFGMKMVELPAREKITLQQRRAAQKKDSQSQSKATTGSWILTNMLPYEFRDPAILGLPAAPTSAIDAEYTAIYTILVSAIMLSGGQLPDVKMDRYLRKLGIDDRTPVPGYEKNEQLMKRLEKDGYLYKLKESTAGGEEDTYYVVGPRGRVEIGEEGVLGLTRTVMPPGDDEEEDLERKVMRSLGIADKPAAGKSSTQQDGGATQKKGRKRKSKEQEEEQEEEEDDDDDEDEEDE